jgi:hypothetical protein
VTFASRQEAVPQPFPIPRERKRLWKGFEKRKPSTEKLSSFLTDPPPKMPDMSLTRHENADLVAYIRSLD